jgi:ATP-binding cassette subfamily B protein
VGENGSGKTTLAKLICGLYRPSTGQVLWNGVDAAEVDRAELHERVAVIFQDFNQYMLSARDNIALGQHQHYHEEERVRSAARIAGADELVDRLPNGYDTMLGPVFEGGHELSIGQWQRLALARAFFRDAPLLILDEPTSALDPRAEYELFSRVRELVRGRSMLLISHRFSSVRVADRICVMDQGRIVESGSHQDLIEQAGIYAELLRLQAAGAGASTGGR